MERQNEHPEYIARVDKALKYIHENLEAPLDISLVAQEASYSLFHFHRIFTALVGEPVNKYIVRKRVERSASYLLPQKDMPISEVAYRCGFASLSSYSKTFAKYYGMSPTAMRNSTTAYSKIEKHKSKDGKTAIISLDYFRRINKLKNWIVMNAKVDIKQIADMDLAYVSHVGPFNQIGQAYGTLMQWAEKEGIMGAKTVTMYHDDPKVTEIAKVRQSACIVLSKPAKPSGKVGLTKKESATYAVGRFEIGFDLFEKAWQSMFVWLNENGYSHNQGDCMEIYHNNFMAHPERKSIVDICIPIIH